MTGPATKPKAPGPPSISAETIEALDTDINTDSVSPGGWEITDDEGTLLVDSHWVSIISSDPDWVRKLVAGVERVIRLEQAADHD